MTNLKHKWNLWWRVHKYNHPIWREWNHLSESFRAWKRARRVRMAKKLAVRYHMMDGKTYYVLPDAEGRPRPFNNKQVEDLKRFGLMHKSVTCADLYREAIWIANQKTVKPL